LSIYEKIVDWFWNRVAKVLAIPCVADAIIKQAMKTQYFHLPGYMNRWWLFNGDNAGDNIKPHPWFPWSARVHQILRRDLFPEPHDHPVNARTFILKNHYVEERDEGLYWREAGDSAAIKFGEFHNIVHVPPDGVWTLFILGPKKGGWGFRINGVKVPWREHLKSPDDPRTGND
jgi:hypothetical protein